MSDDDLNFAERARNKRLKSLDLVACGVGLAAMLGLLAAEWIQGAGWSRSARHGWQGFFWLVYGCSMVCHLILMQKRTDLKEAPSPLSTLGLTQELAGPVKPIRSDHWSDEGNSKAR
jgi:predicted MFS family arabinose efflux permease